MDTPYHRLEADATSTDSTTPDTTSFVPPLDANCPIEIRQGACLPHWTQERATYSVTFRLADSLPAAVVETYESERKQISKQRAK
jgi:hypothetical protein